jgi:hypothetical protein
MAATIHIWVPVRTGGRAAPAGPTQMPRGNIGQLPLHVHTTRENAVADVHTIHHDFGLGSTFTNQ